MNLFSAPLYALTHLPFYRIVAELRLRKSLQYLLLLSAVTTLLTWLNFTRVGFPVIEDLLGWFKQEMPIMTLSRDGMAMDRPSPYTMVHPVGGPLITFDMTKETVGSGDMEGVFVLVTPVEVYVRRRSDDIRVYNVADFLGDRRHFPAGRTAVITPETVQRFYENIRPWLNALFLIIYLPFFFFWKLCAAVFYSWFGLILNLSRKEKLTFSQILNIAIFAMTASIVFQWIGTLIPWIGNAPWTSLAGMLLTFAYLFLALRRTDAVSS